MQVERILIVRTDRLGDVVLSLPLACAIKQKFPDAEIGFLCRKYTEPVVSMSRDVDEIFVVEDENLREKISRYDVAVLVHPVLRDAVLLWRAGIPVRIGTAYRGYSFLFTHRVAEHRKDCRFSEAAYNLHLLRPLGIDVDFVPILLVPPDDAAAKVERILTKRGFFKNKFIAIHPGSGGSSLSWSAQRFAELANILSRKDVPFVITAGDGEYELARYVAGSDERRIFEKLDIKSLAALYSMSAALIAPNTGTLHLADAVGTKTFSVYPLLRTMSLPRWSPINFKNGILLPQKDKVCKKCSKRCEIYPCPDQIAAEDMISHIEKFIDINSLVRGT